MKLHSSTSAGLIKNDSLIFFDNDQFVKFPKRPIQLPLRYPFYLPTTFTEADFNPFAVAVIVILISLRSVGLFVIKLF